MIEPEEIIASLREGGPKEHEELARHILDAGQRGRFPLSAQQTKALTEFIRLTHFGRAVESDLMGEMNRIVRHYEQHLIALARPSR